MGGPLDAATEPQKAKAAMEMRIPNIGQHVKVVDEHGTTHDGLVTNRWNQTINCVFVTNDGAKTDQYGHQLERQSSCMHKSTSSAPGRYWYYPDEEA